jgi:hypothetical protein
MSGGRFPTERVSGRATAAATTVIVAAHAPHGGNPGKGTDSLKRHEEHYQQAGHPHCGAGHDPLKRAVEQAEHVHAKAQVI